MPPDKGYYGSQGKDSTRDIQRIEAELRKIRDTLTSLTSQNIDMHGRRVTNARPSRNDHDYIIRAELWNAIESVRQVVRDARPPAVIDIGKYQLSWTTERLNYGSFTLSDITISQNGAIVPMADIPVDGIYVVAACVDETRITETQNEILAATIPGLDQTNTVVVTGLSPTGWNVGDFILFNDRGLLGGLGLYAFEIFRIESIIGPAVTLSRIDDEPGINFSWFGTPKSAHVGAFYAYRAEVLNFPFEFKSGILENPSSRTGYAERADIIAPNMCVVGIAAALYNSEGFGTWVSEALGTPLLGRQTWEGNNSDSISPGLRTLNGAAYYVSTNGTLSIGLESDISIRPNEDSPVRCLWGYLETAGVTTVAAATDAVVTVEIIEVDETTLVETVIETVNFVSGAIVSGPTLYSPEDQQLPYNPDPSLTGDKASYTWPVPILDSSKRYKTKVTGIGADTSGASLVIVLSS